MGVLRGLQPPATIVQITISFRTRPAVLDGCSKHLQFLPSALSCPRCCVVRARHVARLPSAPRGAQAALVSASVARPRCIALTFSNKVSNESMGMFMR
jgi:hypothetical protein